MIFPSVGYEQTTRLPTSKAPIVSETLLEDTNTTERPSRPRLPGRSLSHRITDLIDEAFPVPEVLEDNFEYRLSSEDCDIMSTIMTTEDGPAPPAYTTLQEPPKYNAVGSLADQLPESFSLPIEYDRMSMSSTNSNHRYHTYHDLVLLAPTMSFDDFLRKVEQKATAYIMFERISKRLLPDEKVVCVPEVRWRTSKRGFLKRSKVVKNTVEAQDWPAVVSVLQNRPGEVELKVKFWTERPDSLMNTPRKERSAVTDVGVDPAAAANTMIV